MTRPYRLPVLLLLLCLLAPGAALADTRVALVIGNNNYATLPDLTNAKTDATAVAEKLRGANFDVILKLDAGRREIFRARAEFIDKLRKADVGLVFYAGHGIQSGGTNWLIPSDARIEVEEDLPAEGIDAQDLLAAMEYEGGPINIMILDACRDNPLPRRTRSASRGLRSLAVKNTTRGLIVLYAAAEGQTAQDGPPGGNGLFTGALLKSMEAPGLTVEQVFKRTAAQVVEASGGTQRPWFHGSLTGDFYFKPKGTPVAMSPTPQPMAPVPAQGQTPRNAPAPVDKEAIFWNSIKDSDSAADYEAYLTQFPNGTFAPLARARAKALKKSAVQPPAATRRPPPQMAATPPPAPKPTAPQNGASGQPDWFSTPAEDDSFYSQEAVAAMPFKEMINLAVPARYQRQTCGGKASFDCRKARTKVEKGICAYDETRLTDCWLAAVYKDALRASGNSRELKQDERDFIEERDDLCGIFSGQSLNQCITIETLARIEELVLDYGLR
ncbi:MAG: caspase family protein [Magnetospiraceae bacterium]